MPTQFLNEQQRHQLDSCPDEITTDEEVQYFSLTTDDLSIIPLKSPGYSKLGFASQLCLLRFLGFVPSDLLALPDSITSRLKQQLHLCDDTELTHYQTIREQTKSDHLNQVMQHLRYRKTTGDGQKALEKWLLARAMEHDRPLTLLKQASEKLKSQNIYRPTLISLERLVGRVREKAMQCSFEALNNILTKDNKIWLDRLLIKHENIDQIPLTWLRHRATTRSPSAILYSLSKLKFLQDAGIPEWDLSVLNANRLKTLSRRGKCATNQSLQRTIDYKRYVVLVAFVYHAYVELLDEAVDLFDQCISETFSRSKNDLKKVLAKAQETTNEKVRTLATIGAMILDPEISDHQLRKSVFQSISHDELNEQVMECNSLFRPPNDQAIDYFKKRFNYLRQFTPTWLNQLNFISCKRDEPLLTAVNIIKILNEKGSRVMPKDAPLDFIPDSWRQYVIQNKEIHRHYYELSTLWELRNVLRSGDIWVEGSRRYNNPDSYLIPKLDWKAEKCAEIIELLNHKSAIGEVLEDKRQKIAALYMELNQLMQTSENIRIEEDKVVITPYDAEEDPPSLRGLREIIDKMLPKINLPDLIIEVDSWVDFASCFFHAGHLNPNQDEFPIYLFAAILSEATNMGPKALANAANLDCERIIWYKNWYIRDETIKAARTKLVNFQHTLSLADKLGDGTFSSSDGRRIPTAVKTRTARRCLKFFGYESGVNLYSWTSDQYSQYGYRVTSPTIREATMVLDAILDNESEIEIERHTTDTAGYTEIIFALFDLLKKKFEPRIKNLPNQQIYYIGDKPDCPELDSIIAGPINTKSVTEEWDEMLRLAGSLKLGYVSSSLFVSKLQALPRKSRLATALQEYGKISKTISILEYAISEKKRREITKQLNKGEALHDLQQFLHLGREGRLYASELEEQEHHFGCLNLLINMVTTWNLVYMDEAIAKVREAGHKILDTDIEHLSPARHAHINRYGNISFTLNQALNGRLRPLNSLKK